MGAYSDKIISLNPIAYWRLGDTIGSIVAVDEMVNYDGIYNGGVTLEEPSLIESDPDNASALFDGVNDYVDCSKNFNDLFDYNKSFTISCVVDIDINTVNYSQILGNYTNINETGVVLQINSGILSVYLVNTWPGNAINRDSISTIVGVGKKYICVTYDGTMNASGLLIYIDSVNESSTINDDSLTLSTLSPDTFKIGWGGYADRETTATIDEVAVFNKVITQQEITDIYNASGYQSFNLTIDSSKVTEDLYDFPMLVNLGAISGINAFNSERVFTVVNNAYSDKVISLNPIAYWRLGDIIGSIVAVDEMTTYDGVYVNSPTLEVTGLLVNNIDTAVGFDGIDQYIEAPATIDLTDGVGNDSPLSFAISFKANSFGLGKGGLITKWNISSDSNAEFDIILDDTGKIAVQFITDSSANRIGAITDLALNINTTYNIVVTYDGLMLYGGILIYVNGEIYTTTSTGGGTYTGINTGTSTLDIGAGLRNDATYKRFFDGIIDEVAIYKSVISQVEAANLYNISIASKNKTLAVIYKNPADGSPPIPPADLNILSQQCKVEIDRWDQTNKQAQLWIKVPYISKDVDTVINLSFDPNNVDNSVNIGLPGEVPAQEVWSYYDAVYHLSADAKDSTINNLDGALVNIDGTNIVDFGVGKGIAFNGLDERIDLAAIDLVRTYNIEVDMLLSDIVGQKTLFDGANDGWYVNADKISYNLTSDALTALLALTNYNVVMQDNTGVGSVFVNGANVDSISLNASNMIVDAIASETLVAANFFKGNLKEIRFTKNIKSTGYISLNYESKQDSLTTYSYAEPFILSRVIAGTISENVAAINWFIKAYKLSDGKLVAEITSQGGAFELFLTVAYWQPLAITVIADQGVTWIPNNAQIIDDLVFPTNPIATPYYYKCTVSGTGVNGITGAVEPIWPILPGETIVDGTVTWEVVERMIQPQTHSPMIPQAV